MENITDGGDVVALVNQLVADNIALRNTTGWELGECQQVILSFRGTKYSAVPQAQFSKKETSPYRNQRGKVVYVNMLKRQYRVMVNYLMNNEPQYMVTGTGEGETEGDRVATREILDSIFQGRGDDEGFYDAIMDDAIHYGLLRGISWTMAYYDAKRQQYKFKVYDSLDTYIDTGARNPRNIKKFIFTYTKNRGELEVEFPNDADGKPIVWDDVAEDNEQTRSPAKLVNLVPRPNGGTLMIYEGLIMEGDKLYAIMTTKTITLKKELIDGYDFMPVTYYSPLNSPDDIYPRGWFVDMLALEREINTLLAKMLKISKTGGRYVYIREGTTLREGTNQVLNNLDIEVIEVSDTQELPQQAQLLQISQQDIQLLDILMRNCEDESGMKQDIMGTASMGSDSSGRAIQALQAGSKNNIGVAVNELNKYMNRLVKIVVRMLIIHGKGQKIYSGKMSQAIEVPVEALGKVKVKITFAPRNAFDEITKQAQGAETLRLIAQLVPWTAIDPHIITKIMGVTDDVADEIQASMDAQQDPDLQIADAENRKLMNGTKMNANQTDNHQMHIALHGASLKNLPPESSAAQEHLNHLRMHDAFMKAYAPWGVGMSAPSQMPNISGVPNTITQVPRGQ